MSQKLELLGALIALARAADGNEASLTPQTDQLVLRALSATDSEEISLCLKQVRDEKNRLAPDCAVCASPCQRTAEGDLSDLASEEQDLRILKQTLLKKIQEPDFANRFPDHCVSFDLYRILFYLGLDCTADQFKEGLSDLNLI